MFPHYQDLYSFLTSVLFSFHVYFYSICLNTLCYNFRDMSKPFFVNYSVIMRIAEGTELRLTITIFKQYFEIIFCSNFLAMQCPLFQFHCFKSNCSMELIKKLWTGFKLIPKVLYIIFIYHRNQEMKLIFFKCSWIQLNGEENSLERGYKQNVF